MVEHNGLWMPVFGGFVDEGAPMLEKNRLHKENRWYKSATPAQTCKVKQGSKVTQQWQTNRGVFGLKSTRTHPAGTVCKRPDAAE